MQACVMPPPRIGSSKFSAQNRDRLPAEHHSVSAQADTHDSPTGRGLVGHELIFLEASAPEGPEAGVGGTGGGVLVDACPRCKESRDEVKPLGGGKACDDES